MTIDGFCLECGISRPTVYRRLKAAGINPASLRDKHGEITTEGLQVLAGITDNVRRQSRTGVEIQDIQCASVEDSPVSQTDADCKSRIDELMQENESLKTEIQSLQERLTEANSKLIALLEQSAERSEQHAQSMQRIAELQVMAHRPSLWKRITGAFHRDTTE